jgi:fructose PTS system EIIA component
MEVSAVINRSAVVLDMEAANKAAVISNLADLLEKDGAITSKDQFITDVYLREAEGKTGIGNAVAIPHGKSVAVSKTCVAIGRVKDAIEWETLDGKPVKLVILFAVGLEDKGMSFVKLMSQVARKIANEEVCEKLMCAKEVDEVVHIFAA